MKINIKDVFTPSDKQKSVGIHGTVNLEVVADNGHVIIAANGISVRKNGNDGSRFLAEPSYKVQKEGEEAKYWSHFRLYPGKKDDQPYNESQRAESDTLTTEILRMLDAGGTKQAQTSPSTTSAAPATASSTPSNNPWD